MKKYIVVGFIILFIGIASISGYMLHQSNSNVEGTTLEEIGSINDIEVPSNTVANTEEKDIVDVLNGKVVEDVDTFSLRGLCKDLNTVFGDSVFEYDDEVGLIFYTKDDLVAKIVFDHTDNTVMIAINSSYGTSIDVYDGMSKSLLCEEIIEFLDENMVPE